MTLCADIERRTRIHSAASAADMNESEIRQIIDALDDAISRLQEGTAEKQIEARSLCLKAVP